MPRIRRRFLGIRGRLSPRKYLGYSLMLVVLTAVGLFVGTWLLALIARMAGLEPMDAAFRMLMTAGLALIGALFLWSLVALAVKRARDARLPTLGFKAGLPALVVLDHFGFGQVTDDRLMGPLAAFTPLAAFGMATVFLFLLLAPRAPIKPLHDDGEDPAYG